MEAVRQDSMGVLIYDADSILELEDEFLDG